MTAVLVPTVMASIVLFLFVVFNNEVYCCMWRLDNYKAEQWKKHVAPLVNELYRIPQGNVVAATIEGCHAIKQIEWLRIGITELSVIEKVVREHKYYGETDFRKLCKQEIEARTGRNWITLEQYNDDDLCVKEFFEEFFDEHKLSKEAQEIWSEAFRTYEVK